MIEYSKNLDFGTYNLFTGKKYNFSDLISYKDRLNNLNLILNDAEKRSNDSNYKINKIICPKQSNGNKISRVDTNNINNEFEETDGLITNLKSTALCASVADGQAILLYDSKNKVIGNIHSGWRGTLNKIIVNAINIMIKEYNCDPSNIQVCIYPSILKCCFEVEKEIADKFKNNFENIDEYITYNEDKNKYFIDLIEINKKEMIKLGIEEKNIIVTNICTKCNCEDYHSYRADKDKSGRHLAIIWM